MAKNKYSVGDIVLVKAKITEVGESDEILDIAIATSENEFYINSGDIHSVVKNKMTDAVKNPSHYQGRFGLEAVDVIKNFAACPEQEEGFYWGNAIKYMLRWHSKNGLEDLKKARQNLDWLIEMLEKNNG
ncbi:phage protein [Streptococcus suis]|nr:phage protein [Streptococcus suis]